MREMWIASRLKHALTARALNLLFPSFCPSCSRPTDAIRYAPFCRMCWSEIKKYTGPSCRVCATPLVSDHADICAACMKTPPPFSRVISFGIYEHVLAMAIHHFKFCDNRRLYRPLGDLLTGYDIAMFDALMPVPLSLHDLRKRGFNQSLLVARHLSRKKKGRLIIDGLSKVRDTAPQVGLSARERQRNVKNAFRAERNFSGMNILLFDDVMTTGATVRECSRQLLKAGAREVHVLTLARAGIL